MRIAVTGSTGTLGSQVVGLLAAGGLTASPGAEHGGHEVLALARRPDAVQAAVGPAAWGAGVVPVRADYDDGPSLASALRGVDVLVFVSSDGDAARMMVHHHNVVRAAVGAGVGHVVYLSGVDADPGSPFCYAFTNGYTEGLLRRSGCGFSFARASLFTEFFAAFLRPALVSGALRVPGGEGRVALVSRSDVGRCLAALALLPPSGRHHDLTGPATLTFDGVAGVLSEVAGIPVSYTDIPPEVQVEELARAGEDPWWTYAYSTMFASVRQDRWSTVSDEVLRLTGRAPVSVADAVRPAP
ncbi:NAD(P)H dehydrogenase (quinone) [Promicromonospora umidemergens]|uniref:SDR family oxidoreductase n=1 Tax=Promicromonospora umidemergens TaxID=629679 RepID=A0ABP8XRC1_9MICO|nr:NmrA family NAD(P)-binding protein [Promicromonospora umidemergens]MCP2281918.1 NAD(P)H dehydrogenase (quinone) [Promicromonospora umidemergens]